MTEQIIGVAKKIFNNEKNHVVIVKKESGEEVKVSAFGKKEPEGLVEGKTYKFDVKESGDFINYNTKTFEEVNPDGEQPEVTTETVGDSKEKEVEKPKTDPSNKINLDCIQLRITLGQACNLAQKFITTNRNALTVEEYDKEFRHQAQRFYHLIRELQEDILNL